MARVLTRGATVATPSRTASELQKALQELCPGAKFTRQDASGIYSRLGAIIGGWSAEQNRLSTLSVASVLSNMGKSPRLAARVLSAHQTGIQDSLYIEALSQLKMVLAADLAVGSFKNAEELISAQADRPKLIHASQAAADALKKQVGKNGRPRADWHDEFTALLFDIADMGGVEPKLWKDRTTDKRGGWLFEAARVLETFLDPRMVNGGEEASGTRLDRSKRRLNR